VKFTNKFKLSDEFVHWLTFDTYDYNIDQMVLSATTLMKPIRALVLEQRWADDLTVDVSELVASRYGTALHDSWEKCQIPNAIQEVRYYRDLEGFKISGKVDLILDADQPIKRLADVKSTSVWNYILNKKDKDYIMQLSIYKWILEANDIIVSDFAEIKYVFTDWSKKDSIQKSDYPQSRITEKKIPLMKSDEVEAFIKTKLDAVSKARTLPDTMIAECTDEELWKDAPRYAVMKRGGKKATKVYDSFHEAIKHSKTSQDFFVETRTGKARRCNYCNVRRFCTQYEQLLQNDMVD